MDPASTILFVANKLALVALLDFSSIEPDERPDFYPPESGAEKNAAPLTSVFRK
jgi:hypothetical protein